MAESTHAGGERGCGRNDDSNVRDFVGGFVGGLGEAVERGRICQPGQDGV